jgi:hypothetical protein
MQEMPQYAPADEYMHTAWGSTGAHIARLLQVKTNIIQSFKP